MLPSEVKRRPSSGFIFNETYSFAKKLLNSWPAWQQKGSDIMVSLAFYICRWPKLGLSTAPVRMNQMLPAASSVCSSSRAGNQMMIPGKKKYATWGAAVKHLICIYITQTCFLYAEDRLLHEVDKSWLLIIA